MTTSQPVLLPAQAGEGQGPSLEALTLTVHVGQCGLLQLAGWRDRTPQRSVLMFQSYSRDRVPRWTLSS